MRNKRRGNYPLIFYFSNLKITKTKSYDSNAYRHKNHSFLYCLVKIRKTTFILKNSFIATNCSIIAGGDEGSRTPVRKQ